MKVTSISFLISALVGVVLVVGFGLFLGFLLIFIVVPRPFHLVDLFFENLTFMCGMIDRMNVNYTSISAIAIGKADCFGICGLVTGLRGAFVSGVCATLLRRAFVCRLRLV